MQRRLTVSWLRSRPFKYPLIPKSEIKNHTPQILIVRPHTLIIKELFALPRPFKILIKLLFIYKKGQIQAKVWIKFPASLLSKSVLPIREPKKRNVTPHKLPSPKPNPTTFWINCFKRVELFSVWISATVGNNMVEIEFVTAVGNRIQGSAIPVKTP